MKFIIKKGKILIGLFGMFRKNRKIMEVSEQNMYAFIEKWLDSILPQKIPNSVVIFDFVLYETGDNVWSIELVGTNTFDLEDDDWICNEVFHFKLRKDLLTWKEEKIGMKFLMK